MSNIANLLASDQYWDGQSVSEPTLPPFHERSMDRLAALATMTRLAFLELPLYTPNNVSFADSHLRASDELGVERPNGILKVVEDERVFYRDKKPRNPYAPPMAREPFSPPEPFFDTTDEFERKAQEMLAHHVLYKKPNAITVAETASGILAVVSRRVLYVRQAVGRGVLAGYTRELQGTYTDEEADQRDKIKIVVMPKHIIGQTRRQESQDFTRQRRIVSAAELVSRS